MATVSVVIPETLQAFARQQASAQGLTDEAEYMAQLLTQAQQEAEHDAALAELHGKIREGLDSGLGQEFTPAWMAEMRHRIGIAASMLDTGISKITAYQNAFTCLPTGDKP